MKKIITILVVVGLVLFILGCTQEQTPDNNNDLNNGGDQVQNQLTSQDTAEIDATLDEMSSDLDELESLIDESEIDIEDSGLDETII